MQNLQSFDQRYKYTPLPHPVPLLPQIEEPQASKPALNRRFSWTPKANKMKPDTRLVAFAALSKATNRKDPVLYDCSLVRAYRGFEKDCIFSPSKADRGDKLSLTDARKVRWILIYTILQTLLSASRVPEQVSNAQNVPYDLSVLTAGCPPWKDERPLRALVQPQDYPPGDESSVSQDQKTSSPVDSGKSMSHVEPDIDYAAIVHRPQPLRTQSEGTLGVLKSRRGTVRRALSTLGNMPDLHHPRPKRASFHEILVFGNGNGTNNVSVTVPASDGELDLGARTMFFDSGSLSSDVSSRWSNSSDEEQEPRSPSTSVSSGGSYTGHRSTESIRQPLERPKSKWALRRAPSSVYDTGDCAESILVPHPLQLKKGGEEEYKDFSGEVKQQWDADLHGEANPELRAYLSAP